MEKNTSTHSCSFFLIHAHPHLFMFSPLVHACPCSFVLVCGCLHLSVLVPAPTCSCSFMPVLTHSFFPCSSPLVCAHPCLIVFDCPPPHLSLLVCASSCSYSFLLIPACPHSSMLIPACPTCLCMFIHTCICSHLYMPRFHAHFVCPYLGCGLGASQHLIHATSCWIEDS